MKQRTITLNKTKIVLRPSPLALKIILTVLILFSMAALIALRWVHQDIQSQVDALKAQASQVEYRNAALEQRTQNIGSVDTIREIAQEELDLVDPNILVIQPEENFAAPEEPSETPTQPSESQP